MTAQLTTGTAACPGCIAGPADVARPIPQDVQIALSLPGIHCSACIATVERELNAHPGVEDARVNLTLKRAMVKAAPDLRASDLIPVLEKAAYEGREYSAYMADFYLAIDEYTKAAEFIEMAYEARDYYLVSSATIQPNLYHLIHLKLLRSYRLL